MGKSWFVGLRRGVENFGLGKLNRGRGDKQNKNERR